MPSGLEVDAWGSIYLSKVTADANGYNGTSLQTSIAGGGTIKVDNTGITGDGFNGNGDDGLLIFAPGDITLYNIMADGNVAGGGAYLDNCMYDGTYCDGSGNIYVDTDSSNDISGSSYFGQSGEGNGSNGLAVYSNGDITLYNVTADANTGGDGAYVDNCIDDGSGDCTGSGDVIVDPGTSYSSVFNGNHYNGLQVVSDGSISLDAVTADYNTLGDGAYLDNCYNPNDVCTGAKNNGIYVDTDSTGTPTGNSSNFNGNYADGLEANSNGLISLSNVIADLNTYGSGAALENDRGDTTEGITINSSHFGDLDKTGNFGNGMFGVNASSNGTIFLSGVTADGNNTSLFAAGAWLDNAGGSGDIAVDFELFQRERESHRF